VGLLVQGGSMDNQSDSIDKEKRDLGIQFFSNGCFLLLHYKLL